MAMDVFGFIVTALLCLHEAHTTDDVCLPSNHRNISYLGERYLHNTDCDNLAISDYRLSSGWYYAGDDPILTSQPDDYCRCGGVHPIWMEGALPSVDEGQVDRTVCYYDGSCAKTWTINVVNCGSFFVYRLQGAPNGGGSYCFGIYKPGDEPPDITAVVETTTSSAPDEILRGSIAIPNNTNTDAAFTVCVNITSGQASLFWLTIEADDHGYVTNVSINESSFSYRTPTLLYGMSYSVSLYGQQRNKTVVIDRANVCTEPNISVIPLTSRLQNGITHKSLMFVCGVDTHITQTASFVRWQIYKEHNAVVSFDQRTHKDGAFYLTEKDLIEHDVVLPFTLLTETVVIHRNETADIELTATVPVTCETTTSECQLKMDIFVDTTEKCSGLALPSCSIKLKGDQPGSVVSVTVQSLENGDYSVLKEQTFDVVFSSRGLDSTSVWHNYSTAPVKVTVLPEVDTYWRGQRCDVLNDPHMFTFDKLAYEHHMFASSEYTLYRHTTYDVEVQHKIQRCNSAAMCNCGLAVRAGRDVFVVSTCDNQLQIGYSSCDDGTLLVKKETDFAYTIYLPYGTVVKSRLDRVPYGLSAGDMVVSVSLLPSVHDQHGHSRGLCGTLDNNVSNEFHDQTGRPLPDADTFIRTWSVKPSASLFGGSLPPTKPWSFPACSCPMPVGGAEVPEDRCVLGADNYCSKGARVGDDACIVQEKVAQNNNTMDLFQPTGVTLQSTVATMRTNRPTQTTDSPFPDLLWNMSSAEDTCTRYLEQSETFRLCSLVPFTDTLRAKETCVQDIMLSQTDAWIRVSVQSMQDSCLSEIRRNSSVMQHESTVQNTSATLTNPTPPGLTYSSTSTMRTTPTYPDSSLFWIIQTIENISCPNDCSRQGRCLKGVCRCSEGFGGDDCSIDLSVAPALSSIAQGLTCDESRVPCTHAIIRGSFFTQTATCHVIEISVFLESDRQEITDSYWTSGNSQSVIEVLCLLRRSFNSSSQRPRRLVGFKISVSNDGKHHEEYLQMFVFNSTCQQLDIRDGKISIQIMSELCCNLSVNHKNVGIHSQCLCFNNNFCYIGDECIDSGSTGPTPAQFCNPGQSVFNWSSKKWTATSSSIVTAELNPTSETSPWIVPVVVGLCVVVAVVLLATVVICFRLKKLRSVHKEKENLTAYRDEYKVADATKCVSDIGDYDKVSVYDVIGGYDNLRSRTNTVSDGYLKLDAINGSAAYEKLDDSISGDTYKGYEHLCHINQGYATDGYEKPLKFQT